MRLSYKAVLLQLSWTASQASQSIVDCAIDLCFVCPICILLYRVFRFVQGVGGFT